VKRFEGLFILDLTNKEEGLNDVIEKIKAVIAAAGGRVESVQKQDRKPFARVTNRKLTAGHYVNVIFASPGAAIGALKKKFALEPDVYRVLFTGAEAVVAKAA
jgi:ribosomal protein S6